MSGLAGSGAAAWALGLAPERDRKERAGGQPLGGSGVSGGAFTNGSLAFSGHTRPSRHPFVTSHTSPPLSQSREGEAVPAMSDSCARQWGGKRGPASELGFRPVASAGWGAAGQPWLPRHVIDHQNLNLPLEMYRSNIHLKKKTIYSFEQNNVNPPN